MPFKRLDLAQRDKWTGLKQAFKRLDACMRQASGAVDLWEATDQHKAMAVALHNLGGALGAAGDALGNPGLRAARVGWSTTSSEEEGAKRLLELSLFPRLEGKHVQAYLRAFGAAGCPEVGVFEAMRKHLANFATWLLDAVEPKQRRGRKPDTDPAKDKRIWDAWRTGQHEDHAGLGHAFDTTKLEVSRALDRHREKTIPRASCMLA